MDPETLPVHSVPNKLGGVGKAITKQEMLHFVFIMFDT